ncbi:MAG: WYL domain-containing protein [Gammaproteobacteria bacterium]|nr:WYL domain-containing protein [Gammaproteobacteria bacterium]MBU2240549.1 WYL domain-containing protein [Gammaproteobacteria bacterium]MBU2320705.1 WYL domain-containing protein [Gammaproteobacteria bacterium]MBU2415048.1 WYL domain-containing protein [Gammaproteobacteria bacterium]
MADTKLAKRLAEIISMLYAGDRLRANSLAEEFNVSPRTIRRDISERLSFLDIQSTEYGWQLNQASRKDFNNKVLGEFAKRVGVSELFPYFNSSILNAFLESDKKSPYLIKQASSESLAEVLARQKYSKLEQAISNNNTVSFIYKEKDYRNVRPYKLVFFDGFWYLAAVDSGQLKAFHIALVKCITENDQFFEKSEAIEREIQYDDTIWFGGEKQQVQLKVSTEMAPFFTRKRHFPKQKIISTNPNGEVVISTEVTDERQLFPLLMKWIPHIRIVEPIALQTKLNQQLQSYIN